MKWLILSLLLVAGCAHQPTEQDLEIARKICHHAPEDPNCIQNVLSWAYGCDQD